jgi:hypothetical protein
MAIWRYSLKGVTIEHASAHYEREVLTARTYSAFALLGTKVRWNTPVFLSSIYGVIRPSKIGK